MFNIEATNKVEKNQLLKQVSVLGNIFFVLFFKSLLFTKWFFINRFLSIKKAF